MGIRARNGQGGEKEPPRSGKPRRSAARVRRRREGGKLLGGVPARHRTGPVIVVVIRRRLSLRETHSRSSVRQSRVETGGDSEIPSFRSNVFSVGNPNVSRSVKAGPLCNAVKTQFSALLLESELIGDTTGKLNIMYAVTTDNILIQWYVFTLAYLTLVTADCGWDTVVLVRARFLRFLLVLLSFVMLEPQERILVHCWYTGDAVGKTDVEKGVM